MERIERGIDLVECGLSGPLGGYPIEVRERLAKTATEPMPMSTAQFTKYFQDDVASTVKLAKDVGIEPN